MRTKIFLLIFTIAICSFGADARGRRHGGCCHDRDRCYEQCDAPRYMVIDGKVFYGDRLMKDASAMSFKQLRDGYACDAWNVYYRGRKMKDVAVTSFKVLGEGYAKDAWNVYYDGLKVENASAGSFEVLRDGYARDTWNTYCRGCRIATD